MWHHGDLTAAAGGVAPAGPPVAYAFNGNHTQHVVYRGTDNHIHELHWSEHGGWHHLDLTTATLGVRGTLAAGDPVADWLQAERELRAGPKHAESSHATGRPETRLPSRGEVLMRDDE